MSSTTVSRELRSTASSIRRILFLCPDLHELGGIGMVSRLSLEALQSFSESSGFDGEVWSYGAPKSDAIAGTGRWKTRYANYRKIKATMWGVAASLQDTRDTLVVAMHLHLAPLALPLVRRGGRLAVFLHGLEAWRTLGGIRLRGLRHATILIANSRFTVQQFKQANPKMAVARVCVCLLGIKDVAAQSSAPEFSRAYALVVGRLSSQERYKGHDALLEIWPDVSKTSPNAHLVIAGDGDDRQRLEEKARQLGLIRAVTFLGNVSAERLASLYANCSFFVMPSSQEGFGLVFLEAMRAGKACIAGEGAASEIVVAGETGFIVPSNNRKELVAAVSHLFGNSELSVSMGRAGRQRYLAEFTGAHFAQRLLAALELKNGI